MAEVKEHPIIFSGPMVRAILDCRKTQTRRVIKAQPETVAQFGEWTEPDEFLASCPYGQPGDRLWVRETWLEFGELQTKQYKNGKITLVGNPVQGGIGYRADIDNCGQVPVGDVLRSVKYNWRSPIYMPRWASRLTLEIADLRVERVQSISDWDAEAEGINEWAGMFKEYNRPDSNPGWTRDPIYSFQTLWDSINAKRGYSWESNPFVWVIQFRVITPANNAMQATRLRVASASA